MTTASVNMNVTQAARSPRKANNHHNETRNALIRIETIHESTHAHNLNNASTQIHHQEDHHPKDGRIKVACILKPLLNTNPSRGTHHDVCAPTTAGTKDAAMDDTLIETAPQIAKVTAALLPQFTIKTNNPTYTPIQLNVYYKPKIRPSFRPMTRKIAARVVHAMP